MPCPDVQAGRLRTITLRGLSGRTTPVHFSGATSVIANMEVGGQQGEPAAHSRDPHQTDRSIRSRRHAHRSVAVQATDADQRCRATHPARHRNPPNRRIHPLAQAELAHHRADRTGNHPRVLTTPGGWIESISLLADEAQWRRMYVETVTRTGEVAE